MLKENKEFNFKTYNNDFIKELSEFIDNNIIIDEDIVGWVMYDLDNDKLMLETLNELTLAESLSEYKDEKAKLVVEDDIIKMIIHHPWGSFNAVLKNIPATKEMDYTSILDTNNDKELFDFVKSLPLLNPRNAEQEFLGLGFELVQNTEGTLKFKSNVYSEEVVFNKNKKTYTAKRTGRKTSPLVINMKLYKAINMKIDELGWII